MTGSLQPLIKELITYARPLIGLEGSCENAQIVPLDNSPCHNMNYTPVNGSLLGFSAGIINNPYFLWKGK